MMPELRITIGGRDFDVACQDGEEHFLRAAAQMLDTEATALMGQIGRVPESRMLLMAGLMLADRTAGLEDQLRLSEARARDAEAAYERAIKHQGRTEVPVEVKVEVPVMPEGLDDLLGTVAARLEALAGDVERRTAS
jgi:cell division protein ZapA